MPSKIETGNAVYIIGYEWEHRFPNRKILGEPTDAIIFEDAGERYSARLITQKISAASGYLGEKRPPVFLVDVAPTEQQMRSRNLRIGIGTALKIPAGILLARLIATGTKRLLRKRKNQKEPAQGMRKRFSETRISQSLSRLFSRLEEMAKLKGPKFDKERRKFLKWLAAGGAGVALLAGEATAPLILKHNFPLLGETISRYWKDMLITGRNAIIAERLEENVSPIVKAELERKGVKRKPIITIVIGAGHVGIESQLKNENFRKETILRLKEEIIRMREGRPIPDPLVFVRQFRFDPTTNSYKAEDIIAPLIFKKTTSTSLRRLPRSRVVETRPPKSPVTRREIIFGRQRRITRRA